MAYLYILFSDKFNRFYVGHTIDLDDRFKRHNQGRSKATKAGVPWKLVYSEKYKTKALAYQREIQIKKWKSRKLIEQLMELLHLSGQIVKR